jgi:hypothetical protein
MSFEAFVQCFKDGEFAGFPSQQIRDAFAPYAIDDSPYDWRIFYDQQNYSDVMESSHPTDTALICGFTVHRPCGGVRLWDTLATILKSGNFVLYFPASCPPLIADERVAQHLPPDMIESLGKPKVITTGQEILDELRAA